MTTVACGARNWWCGGSSPCECAIGAALRAVRASCGSGDQVRYTAFAGSEDSLNAPIETTAISKRIKDLQGRSEALRGYL